MVQNRTAPSNQATGSMVSVICSDCYFEMMYDPASEAAEIVCPGCGHVCDRPDEGQIQRIQHHAKKETTSFLIGASLLVIALMGVFFQFQGATNPAVGEEPLAAFGPLGAMVIGFIGFVIMVFKHDGDRVEAYF